MSSNGFPILEIPFSINRATGDFSVQGYFSIVNTAVSNIISNLTHEITIDMRSCIDGHKTFKIEIKRDKKH
jgi:rRNA maturation endonuclease Nob1